MRGRETALGDPCLKVVVAKPKDSPWKYVSRATDGRRLRPEWTQARYRPKPICLCGAGRNGAGRGRDVDGLPGGKTRLSGGTLLDRNVNKPVSRADGPTPDQCGDSHSLALRNGQFSLLGSKTEHDALRVCHVS